jgi:hypothetical protein
MDQIDKNVIVKKEMKIHINEATGSIEIFFLNKKEK